MLLEASAKRNGVRVAGRRERQRRRSKKEAITSDVVLMAASRAWFARTEEQRYRLNVEEKDLFTDYF